MMTSGLPRNATLRLLVRAATFAGAFMYAVGLFVIVRHQLKFFRPTEPDGIGRVTLDGVSKSADYAGALLFFVMVVPLTLWFVRVAGSWLGHITRSSTGDRMRGVLGISFALPFLAAPMFHLTSTKEWWGVALPPILGCGITWGVVSVRRVPWLRALCSQSLYGAHAMITAAAAGWILFRYLVKGTMIAHKPTLFLEVVFVVFFVGAFVAAGVFIARLAELLLGTPAARALCIYAWGVAPLATLPLAGLLMYREQTLVIIAVCVCVISSMLVGYTRFAADARTLRSIAATVAWPLILFVGSYASTASLSGWIDLFHRGETLGPASDYLLGKKPFLDVFVLHGMLEDGLLDAWLMEIFGRSASVAVMRIVVIGSLTFPVLYGLGLVLFRTIPLALLTVAVGTVTFVDNQRVVFHLATVLMICLSIRDGGRVWAFAAGAFAGLAVFYSVDVGLYSIATVAGGAVIMLLLRRSGEASKIAGYGAVGLLSASLPFLVYLASIGAAGAFFETSFVTVPAIIDPVWSLPYPDLQERLQRDLSLRGVANLVLGEEMRFVLNPVVIAVAAMVVVRRVRRGSNGTETALIAVTVLGALVAQRSALGRADFPHQYFAAYLIAPLLVVLFVLVFRRLRLLAHDASGFAAALLIATAVGAVLGVVLWVPDLLHARLTATIQYRPRVSGVGWSDAQGEAVRIRIAEVSDAVRRVAAPNDPIFDYSNQPAFYFFAQRHNPTRFYQMPVASPVRHQKEVIADLEKSTPRVVLRESPEDYDRFDGVENEVRTPLIARWIEERYELRQIVRGVELWTRRAHPVRAMSLSSGELTWSRDPLIFPAVASAAGASGSDWRSSLLIYNPSRQPLNARLRYRSPQASRDATVQVPPRRTLELTDLVRTLFELPGTSGSLELRFEEGRDGVVTVETADISRTGTASVVQPIRPAASAVAGSPRSTLTIVGVRGGTGRRVNLGLLNTGEGIVRFHASFRTPGGDVIGLPADGTIPEGERFLLVDAERPMGAPLEPGMVIHVRILEGRAIGYASIVDVATGVSQTIAATPSEYE